MTQLEEWDRWTEKYRKHQAWLEGLGRSVPEEHREAAYVAYLAGEAGHSGREVVAIWAQTVARKHYLKSRQEFNELSDDPHGGLIACLRHQELAARHYLVALHQITD
jgi:hypothetical protein